MTADKTTQATRTETTTRRRHPPSGELKEARDKPRRGRGRLPRSARARSGERPDPIAAHRTGSPALSTAEWVGVPIPELGVDDELAARRVGLTVMPLIEDPDTGMRVMKALYRAGFTNVWHSHPCAHGVYVLKGTLKTRQGTFGPGRFVWFPEGGIMKHGATDEGDCAFLFITNKPFDTHYV